MNVRLRRLDADHEKVLAQFAGHPRIRIFGMDGDPPERYRIEYAVKGLVIQQGAVVPKETHQVEIYMTLGYPRQAPQCRMLTPVFHPNIAPHAICVGDHWSAGESLAALIIRIGEMITYQAYNTKSPLNGEAARWAAENAHRLPLEHVDLASTPGGAAMPAGAAPGPADPGEGAAVDGHPTPVAEVGPSGDAQDLLARGRSRLQHGDLPGALSDLDAAIAASPDRAEAYQYRGAARSRAGDRAGAARDYETLLRLVPDHPRADWLRRFVAGTPGETVDAAPPSDE